MVLKQSKKAIISKQKDNKKAISHETSWEALSRNCRSDRGHRLLLLIGLWIGFFHRSGEVEEAGAVRMETQMREREREIVSGREMTYKEQRGLR